MAANSFSFKQFTVFQDKTAFKVGTDSVLLGASADLTGVTSILDIGTGTGLIALILAQRCKAMITAIEPDPNSFLQATENVMISQWKNSIKVINCRLQDFVPDNDRFDLIVLNPPYYIDSLRNPDPPKANARHDSTLNQTDILESMDRLLSENSRLQVIMPYAEGRIFIKSASGYGLFCYDILKIKPLPSSEIRRLILSFARERTTPRERFLVIEKGKRHDFTEDYINLTKDFYLKF